MVDQIPGVMTEALLDGYPRVMTPIEIGGVEYPQTISVTRPFNVKGVSQNETYVQTFTYGGSTNVFVTNISEWVKQ